MTIGASWWTWPSRVNWPRPETTTTSTSTSWLRCGWMQSPRPSRTRLACRSSPSSRHRAPGWFPPAARLARSTGEIGSAMSPSCHPRPSSLERVKRGPGPPAQFSAVSTRHSGTACGFSNATWRMPIAMTDLCCGVLEWPRRRCRRRVRAPAPGRGPAVVAATRPIPRRSRAASRALCVPAGPPAAALDPGPGGVGRRPRRPPGAAGARPAGRELPPRGDSAGIGPGCSGWASD